MVAAAEYGGIGRDQRFTRRNPCPICGGGDDDKRGRGERCTGFLSDDGRYAFCTRPEHAGRLPERGTSPASYKHLLGGVCRCGETHSEAIERPPIDIHDRKPHIPNTNRSHTYRTPDRIHTYHTADGAPYLRVLRYGTGKEKTFTQQRPDGNGDWYDGLEGLAPILYNLPALLAADPWAPVFICEGEKACDALIERGQLATTNLGGAGKWRNTPDRLEALRGRHVVVLADNDGPGGAHADQVAADLAGVAASVRIVALPGLGDKQDVYDWLADGHTTDELRRLAAETPIIIACQSPAQETSPASPLERVAKVGETPCAGCAEKDETINRLRQQLNRRDGLLALPVTTYTAAQKPIMAALDDVLSDPRRRAQRNERGELHVKREWIAERAGLSEEQASKQMQELAKRAFITYRNQKVRDENGRVVAQEIYISEGPRFSAPTAANPLPENQRHGGKRIPTCPHCHKPTIKVVCEGCGCHSDVAEIIWVREEDVPTTPDDTPDSLYGLFAQETSPASPLERVVNDEPDATQPTPADHHTPNTYSPPQSGLTTTWGGGGDAADGNASPTPADAAPDAEYVGADAIPDCPDPKHRKAITALWAYQRTHNGGAPNEKEWREATGYSSSPRDMMAFMPITSALMKSGHVAQDATMRYHLGRAKGGA